MQRWASILLSQGSGTSGARLPHGRNARSVLGVLFGQIGQGWAQRGTTRGQHTAREAVFTSRTGPPPAGMEAAVSPSPLTPAQRADPRIANRSVPAMAGEERTRRRTATHRGHAPTAARPRTYNNPAIRNWAS